MKKLLMTLVLFVAVKVVHAQQPGAAPAGPAPTGIVVGSGNYFSPIVADLDKAVAFYRDGLGFEFQGAPANASCAGSRRRDAGCHGSRS